MDLVQTAVPPIECYSQYEVPDQRERAAVVESVHDSLDSPLTSHDARGVAPTVYTIYNIESSLGRGRVRCKLALKSCPASGV